MSGNENIRDYQFKQGTTYGDNSQVEINHGINRDKKSENSIKIKNTQQASASGTRKKRDKSSDQTKIKPVKKGIKTDLKTGIKITSLKRAKSMKETMTEKACLVKKTAYLISSEEKAHSSKRNTKKIKKKTKKNHLKKIVPFE